MWAWTRPGMGNGCAMVPRGTTSYKIQHLSRVYPCPSFVLSLSHRSQEGDGLLVITEEIQSKSRLSRCPEFVQYLSSGSWAITEKIQT